MRPPDMAAVFYTMFNCSLSRHWGFQGNYLVLNMFLAHLNLQKWPPRFLYGKVREQFLAWTIPSASRKLWSGRFACKAEHRKFSDAMSECLASQRAAAQTDASLERTCSPTMKPAHFCAQNICRTPDTTTWACICSSSWAWPGVPCVGCVKVCEGQMVAEGIDNYFKLDKISKYMYLINITI